MYIYKFLNEANQVIYVGRTNNIIRRIRQQHFGTSGHLPATCYQQTKQVEFAQVASENDARMYELYYIEKYHPIYNKADIGGGSFSVELPELPWKPFEFQVSGKKLTKTDIIHHVSQFVQELEDECVYVDGILRDTDRLSWMQKLTVDERNEYLRIIYSLERFAQNISDHNQDLKEQILDT